MAKYVLEEKIDASYNASSKARDDVMRFVCTFKGTTEEAYSVVGHNDKTNAHTKMKKVLIGLNSVRELLFTLKKNDILFVQSSFKILRLIDFVKIIKGFKTIYLIHDIDTLRTSFDNYPLVEESIDALNRQNVVIAHNKSMIAELQRRGCKVPMVSLEIFDYYTECCICSEQDYAEKKICFAGNLNPNKTHFLYALDESKLPLTMNIYGKKESEFKRLNYCGCYDPEVLPEKLEGQFGLIWEGDDYTYDESLHPYIMYNNPHKASLYIVSGLPIIIWEKAAMADFVRREGIGVTINSISDIPETIATISRESYEAMKKNIRRVRLQLIEGKHLHDAILKAESYLI